MHANEISWLGLQNINDLRVTIYFFFLLVICNYFIPDENDHCDISGSKFKTWC